MIRSNILIFNTCTTLLNNDPHHKKEKKITRYKNQKHVSNVKKCIYVQPDTVFK